MSNSRAALLLTAALGSAMLTLSGCTVTLPITVDRSTVTVTPTTDPTAVPDATASPSPSPTSTTGGATDCGGQPIELVDDRREVDLTGDCPSIRINASGIEVDATAATVGEIAIGGDDNELEAGDVGTLVIAGQDNDADLRSLGALDITGDDNQVDVEGELGSVSIAGNGNEVEGGRVATVVQSGQGNRVTTD